MIYLTLFLIDLCHFKQNTPLLFIDLVILFIYNYITYYYIGLTLQTNLFYLFYHFFVNQLLI